MKKITSSLPHDEYYYKAIFSDGSTELRLYSTRVSKPLLELAALYTANRHVRRRFGDRYSDPSKYGHAKDRTSARARWAESDPSGWSTSYHWNTEEARDASAKGDRSGVLLSLDLAKHRREVWGRGAARLP